MAKQNRKSVTEPESPPLPKFEGYDEALETYSDAINAHASDVSLTLVFGVRAFAELPPRAKAVIHLSPQMGIKLRDLMIRMIQEHEKRSRAAVQNKTDGKAK